MMVGRGCRNRTYFIGFGDQGTSNIPNPYIGGELGTRTLNAYAQRFSRPPDYQLSQLSILVDSKRVELLSSGYRPLVLTVILRVDFGGQPGT